MSDPLYYLSSSGQVSGPFAVTQIRSMWNAGSITADTLINQQGEPDWHELRSLEHLMEPQAAVMSIKAIDPFAGLHTPIKGRSEGSLTWIGWAGVIVGVLSVPLLLAGGIGLPGVLMGVAAYLWCRKPKPAPAAQP